MERINSIHQEWKAWAQKNIEFKRQGNSEYLKRVLSGEGKQSIDEIRRQFSEFIQFEEKLHADRSATTEGVIRLVILVIFSLSVLSGIFLALYSRRQLKSLSRVFGSALQKQSELNRGFSRVQAMNRMKCPNLSPKCIGKFVFSKDWMHTIADPIWISMLEYYFFQIDT